MSEDVHDIVGQKLRRIGQRYTTARRQLVDALANSDRPVTIPEIVELEPALATSSVYRNLTTLERAGVASRLVLGNEHARYELSEQIGHHHHHLVCVDCGAVSDFTLPGGLEESLDQALRRAARREGYAPAGHRLDLTGTCPACQDAS